MDYPEIKITFLGTGTSTGVPMIACHCEVCTSTDTHDKRFRSSILVESKTTTLIVDTTPDFRSQMLRNKVDKLDAVLFTHSHKDHVAGMDDVKAFSFFQHKPMDIYATELTQTALKREFPYVFEKEKYPGVPEINVHTIDKNHSFTIGDISVIPILVYHLNMRVLGFRFGDFTYITDANRIETEEKQKIIGSKILVVNALRKKPHISHFTLQQAIDLGHELNIPEVYFTHVSHQLGRYGDIEQELPEGMHLAYDGLKLVL
ncbi:MAG: MBL fold metallo-hydrolase [Chitinophagaceae bacterium]|nr:MBL fold metallo-hydrolase [Chitinophagaceae bacterium]